MVYSRIQQKRFFLVKFAVPIAVVGIFGGEGILPVRGAGIGCLPPTPAPCTADGVCRPNHELFGYSQTRWRPWPGDPLPEEPTLAEGEDETLEKEMELAPFQRPTPEEEDTRGPSKTKSFTPPEEGAPQALPEPEPEEEFLDFDLQSGISVLPHRDDSPPELPPGLRKFASANQLLRRMKPIAQSKQSDLLRPSDSPLNLRPIQQPQPIVPAAAEQRVGMNTERNTSSPTAVGTAAAGKNRQAIYYRTVGRSVSGQVN